MIEPFSKFYPVGTNPSKKELAKDISSGSLSPGDDLNSAVGSVGDFLEQHVKGEKGYGEWKEGAKTGKLPSFCESAFCMALIYSSWPTFGSLHPVSKAFEETDL